jgi:hypothetical protein
MQMERVGRLLVAGLRDEPTAEDVADFAQLTTADGSTLLALATSLGLDPLLYDRLTVNGLNVHLPCSIRSQLQASYYRQAAHNLRLYGELGALADALHQAKIPVIVLKGAHLAATVYPDIALRKMVDIDLMVAEPQLTAAFEVVQGLGYLPLEPSAPTAPVTTLHHLPRLFKAEALAGVEIHWTIAHPGKPYALANVAELWTRAQPVQLAGIQALGLHPADLLLHLCLHATHHHRLVQGLRPLCDIDRVVRCYGEGFDWQAIGERAQAQKWDKGVHLMLYLAQIWFNTPVPERFLQAIQPAGFTPQRIESALRYMLLDRPPEGEISGEFSHMWRQSSLGGKVKMLLKRWFLPRTTMSGSATE